MSNPYSTPHYPVVNQHQPGPIGKVRNPATGLLLVIVTVGIYGIIWGFNTFDEMKKHRRQGISGGFYLIFSLVPILSMVGIIFPWLRPAYIGRMYAEDGQTPPINGVTGCWVLLPVIGAIILWFRVNDALNAYWIGKGATPA